MSMFMLYAYVLMSAVNFGSALFNNVNNPALDKLFFVNGVLLLIPAFKLVISGKKS